MAIVVLMLAAILGCLTPLPRANAFRYDGTLWIDPGRDDFWSAVIDTVNGYAYFGTSTAPGRVQRIRLSDFTRVGALVLNSGEDELSSAVIDPGNYAYFGTFTSPGRVVRVGLDPFEHSGTLILGKFFGDDGEGYLKSAVIDTAYGYAYFASMVFPPAVMKIRLSELDETAALRPGGGPYPTPGMFLSAVIDTAKHRLYFGTRTWEPPENPTRVVLISDATHYISMTEYPSSVAAGSWTTKYTVQRLDQDWNPVTIGSTTVYLSSSSLGDARKFALTPDGPAVTSVVIPDGSSTVDFYYYDRKAGTYSIRAEIGWFPHGLTVWSEHDEKDLTVSPASLDHIVVSPDPKTVAAGESVTYTAEAFDAYGNSLGDVTGSTSWSIDAGAGGSWSPANVYHSEKAGTWTVTGTCSGKSDTASLNVNAGVLDHFTFDSISSPQVAGTAFSITITARDAFENTVALYAGVNTLGDSTGTIQPRSTGAFTSGSWTGTATIWKPQDDVVIFTSGDGKSGTSNRFDVAPSSRVLGGSPACGQACSPTTDSGLPWPRRSHSLSSRGHQQGQEPSQLTSSLLLRMRERVHPGGHGERPH